MQLRCTIGIGLTESKTKITAVYLRQRPCLDRRGWFFLASASVLDRAPFGRSNETVMGRARPRPIVLKSDGPVRPGPAQPRGGLSAPARDEPWMSLYSIPKRHENIGCGCIYCMALENSSQTKWYAMCSVQMLRTGFSVSPY